METHVGNVGPVVAYAGILELAYEHTRELGTGADKLYYVIFKAFRTRLRYVHAHALGSADVEMGYYVEYLFHLLNNTKARWRNYQCLPAAGTYGLSYFDGFYLLFPHASDGFAKGILLRRERRPFRVRTAMFCRLKGYRLK